VIASKDWVDRRQQPGFSDYELTTAKKQTKLEKFLAEIEVVLP
jgi:IS5 family transposase